jgi:RHS repeat-associated protein
MKTTLKNTFFTLISFLVNFPLVFGQTQLTISNQTLTQGDYKARDAVQALPVTLIAPTGTNNVTLFVDKSMIEPITYGSTNAPITDINRALNLSLPVSSTPASYGVSLGSTSYTIPISVPPGTMNLVPSLSVAYNSMASQGLLGYGWNLTGLNTISRMGKTIYHSGQLEGVNLNNNDFFALDGSRLIATTGTNGASGTLYQTEAQSYSRTTSNGTIGNGPAWFKVETKDGLTIELGNTTDSRLIPLGHTTVFTWMVNKIYDAYGNYISFEYTNTNGEIYIKKINYTGNTTAGIQPYNTINFYYDRKKEVNTVFYDGGEINSTVILRSIDIQAEGNFFKEYVFKYNFNNTNSFLSEVQETAADYQKLNSLLFCYTDDEATALQFQTTNIPTDNYAYKKYIPIDYNQDGKKDLVVFNADLLPATGLPDPYDWKNFSYKKNQGSSQFQNEGTGTLPANFRGMDNASNFYPLDKNAAGNMTYEINDLNGDGWEDLLMATYVNTSSTGVYNVKIYPYLSTSNGFTASTTPITAYADNSTPANSAIFYADFNGDQKLDVFNYHVNGTYESYNVVWLDVLNPSNPSSTINFSGLIYNFTNAFPMDINGDGKAELVNIYKPDNVGSPSGNYFLKCINNNQFVFEKDNSGFTYFKPTTAYTSSGNQCTNGINLYGDFNGDGKSDLITGMGTSSGTNWNLNLGKGNGSYKTTSLSSIGLKNPFPPFTTDCEVFYYSRDVNADGKTDILEFTVNSSASTTVNVFYSSGTSFTSPETYTINEQIRKSYYALNFGDFNGDGTDDLFIYNRTSGSTNVPKIFYFYKGAKSKLLKQAVNGYNTKTEFEYSALSSNAGNYIQNKSYLYPLSNFKGALYVVSKLTMPDGIGGSNVTTYAYENAVYHKQGKGFLGFTKITTINAVQDLKTVNSFAFNNPAFCAVPTLSSSYQNSTGQLLGENAYVTDVNTTGLIYTTNLTQLTQDNNIAGYTTTNNYQYDGNGNLTYQQTIVGNNIEIQQVTNTYTQSGAWIPSKIASTTSTVTRSGEVPFSKQINYSYNTNGKCTQEVKYPGKINSLTDNYTYDASTGVMTNKYAALPGETVSFQYDQKARFAIKKTNSLNQSEEITYDAKWAKPQSVKGVDGLTTIYTYDGLGRSISSITAQGITETITYGWVTPGDLPAGVDPIDVSNSLYWVSKQRQNTPKIKTFYDQFGRERKTETDGFTKKIYTVKSYTNLGAIAVSTGNYELAPTTYVPVKSTYTYDALNRLTKIQSTDNTVTNNTTISYSYVNGNTSVSTQTPDGKISIKTTDPTDLLISSADNGGTITYKYFSHGLLKSTILNGVTVNTITYDEYARQQTLTEPNSGTTTYEYNKYGQLVKQVDAKNVMFQYEYDFNSNHLYRFSSTDGYYIYSYNTTGNGINKLQSIVGNNGKSYSYTYDNFGRMIQEDENIEGQHLVTSYQYDEFNNLKKLTYPSGFAIENCYDANGYQKQIKQATNGQVIWELNEKNPLLKDTKYTLGNGVQTQKTFNNFGMPVQIKAGAIQQLNLNFNTANGNLISRIDGLKGITENFTYDNLDRLTSSQVTGQSQYTISYSSIGNINSKSELGPYSGYDGLKQNAVIKIDNTNSLISSNEQNITYNCYNRVENITENTNSLRISYGPDKARKKAELRNAQTNDLINTRYYTADYEKTIEGTTTTEINYISSTSGLVGMYVIVNGVGTMYYPYMDHLGSIVTVTDAQATVIASQNFDAWGNKRNPNDWSFVNVPTTPTWLYRGFTGHEHLPQFGLINMNARMYDPLNGRMLSPDNIVQDNASTQGYNRYSYCFNNPLKFTDPSGNYAIYDDIVAAVIGGVVNLGVNLYKGNVHSVWQGLGYFGAGAASGVLALYGPAGWAAGGAILAGANTALGGGSLNQVGESAIIGTFSGLIGGAAGQWASQGLGGVVINGFRITSPVLKGAIGGMIGGGAGGYAGGFASGFITTGDLSSAHQAGVQGLSSGAAIGFGTGAVAGYATAESSEINPWSGRPNKSVTIGEGMDGRVNPAATDLNSETLKLPEELGTGYIGKDMINPKAMDYNGQWIDIKIENDYYFYDVGPRQSTVQSPFYNMEVGRTMINPNVYNVYIHEVYSIRILIISK